MVSYAESDFIKAFLVAPTNFIKIPIEHI